MAARSSFSINLVSKEKIIVPEFSPQKRQVIDLIYFAIPVGGTTETRIPQ